MRRLARVCLALAAAGTLLFLAPPPAQACSCQGGTDAEYLARADAVFEGVVTDRAEGSNSYTWIVDVDRMVKGQVSDPQGVRSAKDSAACGVYFDVGQRYRVFASRAENGELTTSLCSGSRPADPLSPPTVGPSTTVRPTPATTVLPPTTAPAPTTSTTASTTTTSTVETTTSTAALALAPTSTSDDGSRGGLAVGAASAVLAVGAATALVRRFR